MTLKTENKIGFYETEGQEVLFIDICGSYSEEKNNGIFIFDGKKIENTLNKLVKILLKLKSIAKKNKINFEYTLKFDGYRIDLYTIGLSAKWAAGNY